MFDSIQENIQSFFKQTNDVSQNQFIYDSFKLPITYTNYHELNDIVCNDLELNCFDSSNNTMHHYLLSPSNEFSQNMIKQSYKYYTTDTIYLKDTQQVIKNMIHFQNNLNNNSIQCTHFNNIWNETKNNKHFIDKYSYIDWNIFKHLNQSSFFLQILSMINMTSPILSLIIPIFFLIFPFLILKLQKIPINFSTYIKLLSTIAKNHFIGKILNIKSLDIKNLIYLIFTIGFYFLQIYQNINFCIKFYNNINNINNYISDLNSYLKNTIHSMESFANINNNISSYSSFNQDILKNKNTLQNLHSYTNSIQPFKASISKVGEIGNLLKVLYIIHSNKEFEFSLKYSVGFNGYLNHLLGIHNNIQNNHIHFTQFSKHRTSIQNQYYPPYIQNKHTKNSIVIHNNIVTGPNASGKTTLLKTTALNIIFSQQYGVGFFDSFQLNPYSFIHSYLNIPDTSGRDSLFQAESRRCKNIINTIKSNKKLRHFTIFDELFSGTNPQEASKTAYAFLDYLSQYKNNDYILTTHYTSICKRLQKNKKANNYKMIVDFDSNNKVIYTYKITKGISNVQGAIIVLEEMDYPPEIIQTIKNFDSKLKIT